MTSAIWEVEARFQLTKCPHCGTPLPLPERVRAKGRTRTEALRNLFPEILKPFVASEFDRWRGPEKVEGYQRDHVHELTKMRIGQLKSLKDYLPVPEAAIPGGRLDFAFASRITREIVAAFEVDPSIKDKSVRKLSSLPEHVLKVLISMNPRGRGFASRVARFQERMERANILHVVVEARET